MKKCFICEIVFPLNREYFTKDISQKDGFDKICKTCKSKRAREHWKKYPERVHGYLKKHSLKIKNEVYNAYGGYICVCCGETNPSFLTLDHINGGGTRQRIDGKIPRGGVSHYHYLKKHNFPSGYQVLCYNCNCGRQHNRGICPHINTSPGVKT